MRIKIWVYRLAKSLLYLGIASFVALGILVFWLNSKLPSVAALQDMPLQVPLKIYTQQGHLIGEYGEKRRTPIKIEQVPEVFKLALLATEDRRFYEHIGVDIRGLARASLNLMSRGTKDQGASTITMQVARNFFLTRNKTFSRKLNEILLALKIEQELSKEKILELYLNKIYFGKRAYGVAAAAQVYYGKSVTELTLAQMAMLAGLPQAPSAINPLNNPQAALRRRSHVLTRMQHYGFISHAQYQQANSLPLSASYHGRSVEVDAPYAAEMARQKVVELFGEQAYTAGLEVYTTIDQTLQQQAQLALQNGLMQYDKRHGYRGPVGNITLNAAAETLNWSKLLENYKKIGPLLPAVVYELNPQMIVAYLANGQRIEVPFSNMQWARPQLSNYTLGATPKLPADIVALGDIIYVQAQQAQWLLSQAPEISGALLALNPHNGAIVAVMGGYDYESSKFNRATQAYRQPGSNFKPFIYAVALENGYTTASVINDAPIVYNDAPLEDYWRPQNDSRRFYGPTRLRTGLTKSRNLVSIRLLQGIGVEAALDILARFGFNKQDMPHGLSLALGTMNTTPLDISVGYAAFANGGFKITPFVINKITNHEGKWLYQANPYVACPECDKDLATYLQHASDPATEHNAPRILSAETAYMMNSMLLDAIQTGTGRRAKVLKRQDIGGKTGTTNDKMDAWFSGFSSELVVTTWLGFDEPHTLKEYAAQAALPIWIDFMQHALVGQPEKYLDPPPGLVTVKIDPETGLLARSGQSNAIFEIFRAAEVPLEVAPALFNTRNVAITPSADTQEDSLF